MKQQRKAQRITFKFYQVGNTWSALQPRATYLTNLVKQVEPFTNQTKSLDALLDRSVPNQLSRFRPQEQIEQLSLASLSGS